jgi:trypsin
MSRFMKAVVVAASLAALLLGASGAMAITNGQSDMGHHPYVGLMVALDKDGFPLWRCSGSELTPTVYLTAGHCTAAPAKYAVVWFAQGPVTTDPAYLAAVAASPTGAVSCFSASFTGYPCKGDASGTTHPNPNFCNPCGSGSINFARHDTGVVKLTSSVSLSRYAQLPTPGLVDTLANKTPIDLVGYGVEFQAQIPGNQLPQPPPFYRWTGPKERNYAPAELVSGNFSNSNEFLRVSLNPGQGKGGSCFGDSGGPNLLGGTDTVLGDNSYVNNVNCGGVGFAQRVDLPDILNWIRSYF